MAKDADGDAPPPRFGAKAKSDTSDTKPRYAPSMTDVVHDDRFAAMHRDPRFMAMPKKASQVAIDARFKGVFDDPKFASGGGAGGRDKRGRKSEGHRDKMAKQRADMAAYYTLDDEDEDGGGGDGGGGDGGGGGGGGCDGCGGDGGGGGCGGGDGGGGGGGGGGGDGGGGGHGGRWCSGAPPGT